MGGLLKQIQSKSQQNVKITVNPVVSLSIADHHLRRNEGQARVIGTLLGIRSEDGQDIEIRNCFPVPHIESKDPVN